MSTRRHPAGKPGHVRWRIASVWLGLVLTAPPEMAFAQDEPVAGEPAVTEASETTDDAATVAEGTPASDPAPAPADDSPTALDEIVVTATRRERSVREIPISIDAFSGDKLRDMGATSLAQIVAHSPGVTAQQTTQPDATSVTIRGSGANFNDFNRPFGLFYEDVPLMNPTIIGAQPDMDPFDLDTVEILKGPQGTLFGGSALIGAVRYVPKKPSFDRTYGELSAGYGTVADSAGAVRHGTAALNVALLDNLAFRFAGSLRDTPGTIYDSFQAREDINGTRMEQRRAIGQWTPWDSLQLTVTYQDREVSSDSFTGSLITNDDGVHQNDILRGPRDESLSSLDILAVRADIDWFDAFTITLNSARLKKDNQYFQDGSWTAPGAPADKALQSKLMLTDQATHELRFVSREPTDWSGWVGLQGWEYVLGAFYMESRQSLDIELFPAMTAPEPSQGDVEVLAFLRADAKEEALYFDATRTFFDKKLELNLGGRFFRQETPASVAAFVTFYSPSSPAPITPLGEPGEGVLSESGFNPKLALTWHFTRDLAIYTSATKGFRFGGVNADPFATGEPPPFYESDSLWNYEIGARSSWLDRTLQFDLTGYQIDWDNKQTPQTTTAQVATQYMINIGGSRIQGVEFATRKLFANGFSFEANGGMLSSRTTEAFETADGETVPPGSWEPNTPRETASAIASYRSDWSGGWTYNTSLAWTYQGKAKNDFSGHVELPAYDVFNLSLVASHEGLFGSPKITFNVLNLEDDRSLIVAIADEFEQDNPDRLVLGRTVMPRTVLMNLQFSF